MVISYMFVLFAPFSFKTYNMKQIFTTLFISLSWSICFAQAPQGVPYQSAIRNSIGGILASQPVSLRFSIHDSLAVGTIVYQETHASTTNSQGIVSLNIGQGTPVTGTFEEVNWAKNNKFLQVEMIAAGGTTYTDLGTQQMMSVPFALHAENGFKPGTSLGEMLYWNGGNWTTIAPGNEGQILAFHDGAPRWEYRLDVGMTYQGGIIAYLLQNGDAGYDPNTPHGIIAAPFDQGSAIWGCYGTALVGADGINIGTGNQNTIDIMNGCTTVGIAARICGDLVMNGYSDWYLPSKDELNKLFINKNDIGNFSSDSYWSSSEYNYVFVWSQNFTTGLQDFGYNKNNAYHVRAVRSF